MLIVVTVYGVTLNNQKAGFRVEGFGFGGLGFRVEGFGFGGLGTSKQRAFEAPRFRAFGLLESRSGIVISIV